MWWIAAVRTLSERSSETRAAERVLVRDSGEAKVGRGSRLPLLGVVFECRERRAFIKTTRLWR